MGVMVRGEHTFGGIVCVCNLFSPIISSEHVDGISVGYDSVLASPGGKGEEVKHAKTTNATGFLGSLPYLAPTNSSQGGSLLQRWTVSKGPKLRVRYSTLSEQLWSKSTLGATLDLQDMAPGINHDIQSEHKH